MTKPARAGSSFSGTSGIILAWTFPPSSLPQHGETAEGRTLRNVLKALVATRGDFAESEFSLFSTETLTLAKALAQARLEGRYVEADRLTF